LARESGSALDEPVLDLELANLDDRRVGRSVISGVIGRACAFV